jgi:hypothetical protein
MAMRSCLLLCRARNYEEYREKRGTDVELTDYSQYTQEQAAAAGLGPVLIGCRSRHRTPVAFAGS